jgi:hypothetical protein
VPKRLLIAFVALAVHTAAFASDYLFINVPYLKATREVITEANVQAASIFQSSSTFAAKYADVSASLTDQIRAVERKRLQKKTGSDVVTDTKDKQFADTLNAFKDALNAMSQRSGRPLRELLPSYDRWNKMETAVVQSGVDERLSAYQTRYGPDSEPINIVELLIGEKFLTGDESGPSAWEPILRLSAVQITTRGSGLTSSFQIGANYYFVNGVPKPLGLVGLSNHIGLAAALQYLDDPAVFDFKGRPSFGAVLHADRKEIGVMWDNVEDKFRLTLGYSFQFVPFVF